MQTYHILPQPAGMVKHVNKNFIVFMHLPFILSSLEKEMDVQAYEGQFHSTDASAHYSAHHTFNFLMLLVCFAETFSHNIIVCREGIGLFLMEKNMREIDQPVPRKLRIYFYKDKIYYWFNKAMHHYTHAPTVRYIYHLMSLLDEGGVE